MSIVPCQQTRHHGGGSDDGSDSEKTHGKGRSFEQDHADQPVLM
ncbi:MAG: hypothetical protein VKK03_01975 [Synechococcus sp.]|nr:hypothetical protein [Synechococcus sp.]